MAGEGTALAMSIEVGRGRTIVGIEKLRAKEAREGKLDPDATGGSDGGCVFNIGISFGGGSGDTESSIEVSG